MWGGVSVPSGELDSQLFASFSNTAFSAINLVTQNLPPWGYSHHWNWQQFMSILPALQETPLLNIYQHTTFQASVHSLGVNIALNFYQVKSMHLYVGIYSLSQYSKIFCRTATLRVPHSGWISQASIFVLVLSLSYGGKDINWFYIWECADFCRELCYNSALSREVY